MFEREKQLQKRNKITAGLGPQQMLYLTHNKPVNHILSHMFRQFMS